MGKRRKKHEGNGKEIATGWRRRKMRLEKGRNQGREGMDEETLKDVQYGLINHPIEACCVYMHLNQTNEFKKTFNNRTKYNLSTYKVPRQTISQLWNKISCCMISHVNL